MRNAEVFMKVKYRKVGDKLTIGLVGELDHHSAEQTKSAVDDLVFKYEPKNVIFDFSELSFMDSTGIGMLLTRYKTFNQRNISVYVTGARGTVEKLLKLSGIYKIFTKIEVAND